MDLANRYMFPGAKRRADAYAMEDAAYRHYRHNDSRTLVLYSHGNGCLLEDVDNFAWALRENAGVNVLLYEYPGYAEGNGSTQELANRAARHYLQMAITEMGYAPEDIVLMGKSIGTGPTCLLAAENPHLKFRGVVLLAPFTDITSLASSIFKIACGGVLGRLLYPVIAAATWNAYDNRRALGEAHSGVPVLLAHGVDDVVIPSSMSDELQRAHQHNRSVQLMLVDGGHNTPISDKLFSVIVKFINASRLG